MIKLITEPRQTTGKQVKFLRRQGKIPAVVYGHGSAPQLLAVDYLTFDKIYREAGGSTLIDLVTDGDGKSVKVLIQEVSLDPVTNRYQHIDFHQVKMDEKISAEVPIIFIGEAKAVKELGGVLVKNLNKLRVECLPQDLQHEVQVDISSLDTFDSSIAIKDLKLPTAWKILDHLEELIVGVEPPRSEEDLAKLKEQVTEDVSKIEKVEDKAKEDKTEEAGQPETK